MVGTDRLCSLICAVAENMTVDGKQNSQKVMGEMIPSSYLTLAKMVDEKRIELEKEEKLPLLHRCKFQELVDENATKHVHDYFDPGDIDIATEFLHNIGMSFRDRFPFCLELRSRIMTMSRSCQCQSMIFASIQEIFSPV